MIFPRRYAGGGGVSHPYVAMPRTEISTGKTDTKAYTGRGLECHRSGHPVLLPTLRLTPYCSTAVLYRCAPIHSTLLYCILLHWTLSYATLPHPTLPCPALPCAVVLYGGCAVLYYFTLPYCTPPLKARVRYLALCLELGPLHGLPLSCQSFHRLNTKQKKNTKNTKKRCVKTLIHRRAPPRTASSMIPGTRHGGHTFFPQIPLLLL